VVGLQISDIETSASRDSTRDWRPFEARRPNFLTGDPVTAR
jgi:hypothetical protein